MKVVFVTRRQHNISNKIQILLPREAREITRKWTPYQKLAHDIETSHWDPYLGLMLLEAWFTGNIEDPIIVIDRTSVETGEVIGNSDLANKLILAHNADFEARWNIHRGLTAGEYYCTMVADQTIMSGIKTKYTLVETLTRRMIPLPTVMDKEVRAKFIGKGKDIVFEDEDVFYNAGDVLCLHELEQKQYKHIEKLGMNFLVHRLRSPLVKILAYGELTGFVHDTESWLKIADQRTKEAAELSKKLDKYLIDNGIDIKTVNTGLAVEIGRYLSQIDRNRARITKLSAEVGRLEQKGKTDTKAYATQKEALAKCLAFQPPPEPTICVNWSSSQQPVTALKLLGIPIPKARDKKKYGFKEGIGKEARNNWFAENPTHPRLDFMKLLDKFKKTEHNIKSFGPAWIERYINPVTGKAHTCFRQAGTRTGRFASGNKNNNYFNIQQIPSKEGPEYRNCFRTDPGRAIATLDYKGCEVVCMVSLARDFDLKRVTDLPDQHSYMGTKCWRAVYNHRYEQTRDPKWLELAMTYEMKNEGEGKKFRTKFKESGIFPVIYGVKEHKVAAIQGFSPQEGRVFIETIEAEMPNVVKFVKSCAETALKSGYVVHNTRTNSRRWFMQIFDSIKHDITLSNKDRAKIETAARNSPVQGTNVDIIIEAIVTIARWARLYKVDVRFLGQVHDELIYDFPIEQDWIPGKLKELMKRAAKRYLIPEIDMDVDLHVGDCWTK
jgi:DNA polymerase I-like protein with 3'-5' exonuclease and polymerase domains